MILFAVYAVLVWVACWRWRRTWRGYAAYVGGLAGLGVLWGFYRLVLKTTGMQWEATSLALIVIAEAFIIAVVGGVLVTVRRERAVLPCRGCGYELAGLAGGAEVRCPECGVRGAARRVRACRECGEVVGIRSGRVCEGCQERRFVARGGRGGVLGVPDGPGRDGGGGGEGGGRVDVKTPLG